MRRAAGVTMATRVVATAGKISCDIGDETVLLDIEDGEYYGLNAVAATVWRRIETPTTLATLREALLAEYSGISPDECESALVELVEEMFAIGVARVHQGGTLGSGTT